MSSEEEKKTNEVEADINKEEFDLIRQAFVFLANWDLILNGKHAEKYADDFKGTQLLMTAATNFIPLLDAYSSSAEAHEKGYGSDYDRDMRLQGRLRKLVSVNKTEYAELVRVVRRFMQEMRDVKELSWTAGAALEWYGRYTKGKKDRKGRVFAFEFRLWYGRKGLGGARLIELHESVAARRKAEETAGAELKKGP